MYVRFGGLVDFDVLVSDGYLGLVKAADRFNPVLGATFRTFATYAVRGAMIDGMRDRDHVPRSVRKCDKVGTLDRPVRRMTSLNGMSGEDGSLERIAAMESSSETPPGDFWSESDALESIVNYLRPRDRLIMMLHYGENRTMRDIARMTGVTASTISLRHSAVIRRLRLKMGVAL